MKLSPSMTLEQFDRGYRYATAPKTYAGWRNGQVP